MGLKYCNDSKTFVKYANETNVNYESIEEYNPTKEHKILIVFDDMIAGMISNNKTSANSNKIIY